jgi:hypothetical protein
MRTSRKPAGAAHGISGCAELADERQEVEECSTWFELDEGSEPHLEVLAG